MSSTIKTEFAVAFQSHKEQFPSDHLDILNLYFEHDLSAKEISLQLNLPIAKVRHRITQALYAIRKLSNDPEYIKAREILYGRKKH